MLPHYLCLDSHYLWGCHIYWLATCFLCHLEANMSLPGIHLPMYIRFEKCGLWEWRKKTTKSVTLFKVQIVRLELFFFECVQCIQSHIPCIYICCLPVLFLSDCVWDRMLSVCLYQMITKTSVFSLTFNSLCSTSMTAKNINGGWRNLRLVHTASLKSVGWYISIGNIVYWYNNPPEISWTWSPNLLRNFGHIAEEVSSRGKIICMNNKISFWPRVLGLPQLRVTTKRGTPVWNVPR